MNQYRAIPADALVVRPLDDITILYHRPSGQTHMVVSPVPEILAMLAAHGQGTAQSIHDGLSADFDLGPADAALAEIAHHLDELAAIGLAHHESPRRP